MKKEVFAYLHTHWDREWYRPFEEFRLRLIEVFDEVLLKIESGEIPCFYFDGQVGALEDYLEIRPQMESRVKKYIKEKKLYIGPFYCSTDGYLINAVSFAKNIELGLEYSKRYGENEFIAYMCDIFAHPKGIIPILKNYNLDCAIIWRAIGSVNSEIVWEGLKTARLVRGYFMDILHMDMDIQKKAELLEQNLDKIAQCSSDKLLLPIGADHLAVLDNAKETIDEVNKYLKNYEIKISTPIEYLKKVDFNEIVKGELRDNSSTFILSGVYSSRIPQKIQNAFCQFKLYRLAYSLNSLFKMNFDAQLEYASKLLIKNQAHDTIYGCSTDEVHQEALMRLQKIEQVTNGVIKRIKRNLENSTDQISVFNASNYEYSGPVLIESVEKIENAQIISSEFKFSDKKLYNTRDIPVTEDIFKINKNLIYLKNLKPFSLTKIIPATIDTDLYIEEQKIGNSHICLEIEDNKINIIDLDKNKTYNDFLNFTDTKDEGDSYNYAPFGESSNLKIINTQIIQKGPIRAILGVLFEDLSVEISLDYDASELVFNAKINNKKDNHKIRADFRLNEPIYQTVAEDILGVVKRTHDPSYSIQNHMKAPRGVELKPNTYPMQNFVSCQDIGLVGVGLNEYEVNSDILGLTLLRATGMISRPDNPVRGTPAGPPLLTPELQCKFEYIAKFALTFKNEIEELFKLSEFLYEPYIALFMDTEDKEFFTNEENELTLGFDKDKRYLFNKKNNQFKKV